MQNGEARAVPQGMADSWQRLPLGGLAALALSSTFVAVGLFTIGGILPPMTEAFKGQANSAMLIQLIGSVSAPSFALASPVAGRLAASMGVRRLYGWSLVLFLAAGLAPIMAPSLAIVLALRIVLGIAVAGAFTAGMAGIAQLPERQRHRMYGISALLAGGVAIGAYQIVGSLAAHGWRNAFLVHLLLVPAAAFWPFLPKGQGNAEVAEAPDRKAGALAGVPALLVLAAAVVGWAMISSSIFSPFYLVSIGVTDAPAIGTILAAMAFCSLAGSGSYGTLQGRLGTAGVMKLGMLIAAVGALVLFLGQTVPLATVGLGVMGLGQGLCGTAVYGLAVELAKDANGGKVTGLISLAVYLPQVVFPTIAAIIASAFGAGVVFGIVAALLLAATLLLRLLARPE